MLTALVLVPVLGALGVLALPAGRRSAVRAAAIAAAVLALGIAVAALLACRPGASLERFRLVERTPWIPALGAEWFVGADGLRAALAVLVALLALGAALTGDGPGRLAAVLGLEGALLGTLLALDLLLVASCWTAAIVLAGALAATGEGAEARREADSLLGPGLAGAALQLAAVLLVRARTGTLDLGVLGTGESLDATPALAELALGGLLAGFLLPAAAAALAGGCAVSGRGLLAGTLLPVGAFGMLAIALPILPAAGEASGGVLAALGAAGLLLGGVSAIARTDLHGCLASAVLGHAGLLLLAGAGAARGAPEALAGGTLHLLAAAIALGAAGAAVAALRERAGHAEAWRLGGLLRTRPRLGLLLALALLAMAGLPGLATFASGILVLRGGAAGHPAATLAGVAGAVLLAAGIGRAGRIALLGAPREPQLFDDLGAAEAAPLALLAVLAAAVGLWPAAVAGWLAGPLGPLAARLAGGQ